MKIPLELLTVAKHLGALTEDTVFVGGMIRGLLITDPAAGAARPTDDVDLIVDTPTYKAFTDLNETLRARGVANSNGDADRAATISTRARFVDGPAIFGAADRRTVFDTDGADRHSIDPPQIARIRGVEPGTHHRVPLGWRLSIFKRAGESRGGFASSVLRRALFQSVDQGTVSDPPDSLVLSWPSLAPHFPRDASVPR